MIIDLWNDLIRWARSDEGWAVIANVIVPFVAILAAGIVAALIARSANRRLLRRQDDESKAAAIAALLAVSRRATVWTSLSAAEKDHVDYQITEAVVRLRLQPISGSDLAAEWAQLRIASIKRQSAAMLAQAEGELRDLENGLIEWHRKPSRAKKLFGTELGWLRLDDAELDKNLLARQKQWLADQQKGSPATDMADAAATAPIDTADLTEVLVGSGASAR